MGNRIVFIDQRGNKRIFEGLIKGFDTFDKDSKIKFCFFVTDKEAIPIHFRIVKKNPSYRYLLNLIQDKVFQEKI